MIPSELLHASTEQQLTALKSLLLEKSIRTGTFTLASGKQSDLYVDCRVTAMDPLGANLIGAVGYDLAMKTMRSLNLTCQAIGGMTLGADPISLAIGMTSLTKDPLQVFTVRKEAKKYGQNQRIEGNFQTGQSVIVVDDVITTGGSTLKAIQAIQDAGGNVAFALILVDREEGGREAITSSGVPVVSLFTRNSLLNT